jgi:hypothetical protein
MRDLSRNKKDLQLTSRCKPFILLEGAVTEFMQVFLAISVREAMKSTIEKRFQIFESDVNLGQPDKSFFG